jgi:hypothetical protein
MAPANVHRKCFHFNVHSFKCNLKDVNVLPWNNSCSDYDLKKELKGRMFSEESK